MRFLDEAGTIEPTLVLIPLLILVLSTLQIAGGVYARATATYHSQATLYDRALFDGGDSDLNGNASNPFAKSFESSSREIGLSGGGSLLVGEEKYQLPSVTPLLPGGDSFTTYPIAISENP